MESTLVRVGLIGTGVGIRTILPGLRATGQAEVVAVSGSSLERAKAVAAEHHIAQAYANYLEICQSDLIDLICVASPNDYHTEHARAALATDKYVLIEKPLAIDAQGASQILAGTQGRSKWALVDHQLRYNPHFQELRAIVRRGELGRIYFVRIHQQGTGWSKEDVPLSWSFNASAGGGVRLAMGSHLVDLLRFLTGDQPTSVTCTLDAVRPERMTRDGRLAPIRVSASFAAQLDLQSGTSAHLTASAAATSDNRFDIDMLGTSGEAHFTLENKLYVGRVGTPLTKVEVRGVTPEELNNAIAIFKGSFVYFARAIVQSILTADKSSIEAAATLGDAVATQTVLDAMLTSANTGEKVALVPGWRPSTHLI